MDYNRLCRSAAGVYYAVDDIEHMLTFMRDMHRYTAATWATSVCGR
jgi:hypothetical protein